MTHHKRNRKLLAILLVLALSAALMLPAAAVETGAGESASKTEPISRDHALTDPVRVSIALEKPSTVDRGYSLQGIASNPEAVSYRDSLKAEQNALQSKIEAALGVPLDVKWNLTLLMNVISANVRYGDIDTIKQIPGVLDVFPENRYEAPRDAEEGEHPNTANTSVYMVGAADTWAEGYTGAGSRIAIIDTGLDTSHQSVDADAFNYAIQQTGKNISLFTSSDLNSVKSQLNGSSGTYRTAKIPFGYNYVDRNNTITHLNDTQGEHGSHVAGIAAANRYIRSGSSYVDAASTVHAVGMAPDAQLFVMKVFGSGGGASDSDYMAAIEDAIVLGCDAVNLSLGSSVQGFTYTSSYQSVMNKLANPSSNPKMVTSISAGNSFDFAYFLDTSTYARDLYIQDVYMHTGGSPGTFVNSLCVASADNTGVTGAPLTFNGNQTVFYTETDSSGAKMTTVAGTYDYVYIDGVGSTAEYSALGSSLLRNKVVIVNRGELSFYEKGNNLKSYSPKALIVANNVDGTINMALDDYTGSFPMVSITLGDANTIKANSAAHTAGSYTYYTGSVQVSGTLVSQLVSDNAEMSDFSSWGVPGSLLMKPEITAPGGNIYSIAGTNKTSSGTAGGSDQYELMSGTSMAAPHITGLTGTLAQYIKEKNISISGKTNRQIMQSLLMSTAVPMHIGEAEGPYYPILRQGAGLANVRQAVHASSLIFMNADATISYADGKVKAEIGDKPGKSGSYSYSFTLYNTAGQAQTYNLSTDLFTQDRYEKDGVAYMSKSTAALPWQVSYSTGNTVTVGANSSKSVTVTIQIPEDMSAFDELYPAGAYVEGYTYVESQTTTSDGEKLDVRHSIPILGFYGSWTDPSMFDTLTYVDKNVYGDTRTNYSGVAATNYMTYKRSNSTKYVTGNPYTAEKPFPYEKLALRSTDTITQIQYKLVRAAGSTGFAATRLDDAGKVTGVISATVSGTNVTGMYYNQSSSAWVIPSTGTYSVNKAVSTYGSEGDRFRVGFYAIPEYNAMQVAGDKTAASAGYLTSASFQTVLKSNVLGRGAMVGYDFFIDNTAPTILSAVKNGSGVTVQVRDNCYIAWLALVSSNGSTTYAGVVPRQSAKGETVTYTFDVSGLNLGNGWKVLAGDYASNEATAEATEPAFNVTAVSNNEAWGAVSVTGSTITAAPADGYYVESCDVISGSAAYTIDGNVISVSATADCTIRVNFAPKPSCTVNFVACGSEEGSQTAPVNDSITLPETVSVVPEGWSFVGWMTRQIDETADRPEFLAPGASYTVTGNGTLYALYTRVIAGTGGAAYQLAQGLEDGGEYILVDQSSISGTAGYAVGNTVAASNHYLTAVSVTVNGDDTVSAANADAVLWKAAAVSNGYSLYNAAVGKYMGLDASEFLYPSATALAWAYTASGYMDNQSDSEGYYYLSCDSSNVRYTTSKNGKVINLYKAVNPDVTYYWTDPAAAVHAHSLEYVAAAAPSCGAEGHSEYWYCSVCGKYFSDEAAENEITLESTLIPAAGAHSFGPWTANNDGTHRHVCELCGAEEREDCTYTELVTPPTVTEQGYTTHICELCGDTFVDEYTEPLGSDYIVHFSVPEGVTAPADMISNTNTGITLPTVGAPEGYTFLGWVEEDYDHVEMEPEFYTGSYIAYREITLKALFTYTDYGENRPTLTLMEPTDSFSDGDKIVIVESGGTYGLYRESFSWNHVKSYEFNNDAASIMADAKKYFPVTSVDGGWYLGDNINGWLYTSDNQTNLSIKADDSNFMSAFTLTTYEGHLALQHTVSYNTNVFYLSCKTNISGTNQNQWSMVNGNNVNGVVTLNIYKLTESDSAAAYYTTIIEAHTHTAGEAVIENNADPTCIETGSYDSVVYCSECGEEISREHVTVPALGHDWDAGTVIREATIKETGIRLYTCNRCQETREEVVPCLPLLFDDVQDESRYYFEPVYWAFYHEPQITNGVSENSFGPNLACTRAQVVTFLYRAAGSPAVTGSVDFSDVSASAWYHDAVLWAVQNEITSGTSAATFSPNQPCTRAQAVTFLYRSAGEPEDTAPNPFLDVADGAWYHDAVLWALSNGITIGTSETTFSPDTVVSRGQVVTFLWRCMGALR